MAQQKILLDTCVYLRLGKYIHPLLRTEFGDEDYCLYMLKKYFIDPTIVTTILTYLERLPDLPKHYWYDRKRFFPKPFHD